MANSEYKSIQNLNRIFIIISLFSAVLSGSLFIWYYNANNRIKQIERIVLVQSAIRNNLSDSLKANSKLQIEVDSLLRKVEFQETKIEYFLQQIDIQSNWFIFFVSGVFVVFGVTSYAGFRYEIKNIIDAQHEQEIAHKIHFDKFDKKFKLLNKKHLELTRNWLAALTTDAAKKGEHYNTINFGLQAIDYNLIVIKISESEKEKNDLTEQSVALLKVVLNEIKRIGKNSQDLTYFKEKAEYEIYMNTVSRILLNENLEIKELCRDVIFWLKKTLEKWGE